MISPKIVTIQDQKDKIIVSVGALLTATEDVYISKSINKLENNNLNNVQ